jgi:hypothetical protein
MTWIKLTHAAGSTYINVEQVYRIDETSSVEITLYDANSILPTSYTFANPQAKREVLAKLNAILSVIDIDQLATQG